MRPFSRWPRWAIDLLRAVLVRVPVLPAVLFDLDCEVYARDTVVMSEEDGPRGYPCNPPGGVH